MGVKTQGTGDNCGRGKAAQELRGRFSYGYVITAYIVMAYIVMAYIVTAFIVMACISASLPAGVAAATFWRSATRLLHFF